MIWFNNKLYLGELTMGPESGLIRELNINDGSIIKRPFAISGDEAGVKDLGRRQPRDSLLNVRLPATGPRA